jgi:hypothetical protein
MSDPGSSQIRLTCRPGKTGSVLTFDYIIENQGPGEVYAMDAMPSVKRGDPTAKANPNAAVVILNAQGDAIVGKFIAPLPTDKRVAVPVVPLARRVAAGASLQGKIELPLPLAETSPYFPDLLLRQYEALEIKGVVFTIGYWLVGTDNLFAAPVDYAPDLFTILTRNTIQSARSAWQRFPTTGLQLYKRTDAFPRPD